MKADKSHPGSLDDPYRRYLAALVLFHQAAADRVGLGATDYQACNLLELEGPITSGELARRLGLSTGATTRLVDRLVEADLVRRVADPTDRRRALVEHAGRLPGDLADVLSRVRAPIAAAVEDLDDHQREGLGRYLGAAAAAYTDAARGLADDGA